jgi:histo-blood group ABO system transferase
MFKKFFILLVSAASLLQSTLFADKIGLLVMATGKYIIFVEPLIRSARAHFCPGHEITFFIFTDKQAPISHDIVSVFQSKLGWPFDTMMRNETYASHKELFASQDYLFACDADMLFVDTVGDEILGERVATMHPGFVGKRGSYETSSTSLACVSQTEGECYFAGGFYGGSRDEFLNIASTLAQRVNNDLKQGVIAVWHDESHWNRYCIDHKPTVILTPSYCYPESWDLPYQKKLLALDKDHKEFQQ